MLKTLLSILPALALIVFVNSHKSSLFGTAKYQLVAEQLLANKTYFGPIDYDERAFQKLMAQRLPDTFTTLIVGSSRTMSLSSSCVDGPSYNASVSGAMLSDVTAIIEQFRRGRRLRHIVLTAEPWMLNAHEQSVSWTTSPSVPNLIRIQAAPDWIRAQLRLGLTPHIEDFIAAGRATLEPIRQLFDPAGFSGKFHWQEETALQIWSPDAFRKVPNGTLTFPLNQSPVTDATVLQVASEHLAQTYAGFDRVDPILGRAFKALTRDLIARGIHVTLVLAPFHPVYYDEVGKILPMSEAFYRSLHLETVGSYNPAAAQVSSQDFYDAVHLLSSSLRRVYGCPLNGNDMIE